MEGSTYRKTCIFHTQLYNLVLTSIMDIPPKFMVFYTSDCSSNQPENEEKGVCNHCKALGNMTIPRKKNSVSCITLIYYRCDNFPWGRSQKAKRHSQSSTTVKFMNINIAVRVPYAGKTSQRGWSIENQCLSLSFLPQLDELRACKLQ